MGADSKISYKKFLCPCFSCSGRESDSDSRQSLDGDEANEGNDYPGNFWCDILQYNIAQKYACLK